MCLTATASPKVEQGIIQNLAINDIALFKSSLRRNNLFYELKGQEQKDKELIRFIQVYKGESGIAYCHSRKKVDEVTTILRLNGIQTTSYHAGLDTTTKEKFNRKLFSYIKKENILQSMLLLSFLKRESILILNLLIIFFIIQQIDRRVSFEQIMAIKALTKEELIEKMEAISYAGTKLDLSYHLNRELTKEQQEEVYNYFMNEQEDSIKKAINIFKNEFSAEEIRLIRIQFLSEVTN